MLALAISQTEAVGTALFYLFALVTGGSAVAVVVTRNVVRMAVALLGTLAGVAGLYFLLNAEFLAAVQLVIYVGGTLILIVFGVMLTSKSPFSRFEPSRMEVLLALSATVLIFVVLVASIVKRAVTPTPDQASAAYPIQTLGMSLLGDYLVPFELASILLLSVMIGAAYLAKGRRRERI